MTSFVKMDRSSAEVKKDDIIRKELARVRATNMEESFGTQKKSYSLRRVKARIKLTENPIHLLRHPHGERGATCEQAAGSKQAETENMHIYGALDSRLPDKYLGTVRKS